ncbi:unnamed protein product [Enterobius vermicularis]|uniref:DUF5753 domain-containing protein n=1 Tax=Enterobius vermicularis TaxID=51028 RepID=A0A0N4V226_ENTVE|nr:unnamed protein product [Enterobius vermicularis]
MRPNETIYGHITPQIRIAMERQQHQLFTLDARGTIPRRTINQLCIEAIVTSDASTAAAKSPLLLLPLRLP